MRIFIPERFALTRTLREDRQSKTFVANDHLLDRENVIVRIIRRDHVQANRKQLIEHFSWLIGVQYSQFAKVFDAGLTKQQHLYYVREYLSDSELLSADPFTTMKWLVSVVDFLARHGRIHGRIKPSNIFVTKETLKLADAKLFGVRLYDEEESVHFAAPEILQGGDISHEGDLYSLGAVLYGILTGRHPFEDPDLSRLRSKYLSASLQPAPYLSPVSQYIFELVLELLSRNPSNRTIAFERLKGAIATEIAVADGGVFVGREDLLQQALEIVQRPTGTLQVLLIEGEIGIGKSRFVKEMRLHCAFRGLTFVAWQCMDNADELAPVRGGLQKLLRSGHGSFQPGSKFDSGPFTPALSEYLADPVSSPLLAKRYPLEKTISDVIAVIGSLARRGPTVLTLEDVDVADAGTLRFLDQLAFRASELPITLVLTNQPSEHEPKWIDTMAACLGAHLVRVRLSPFSDQEAETLVRFFENDRDRQLSVLQLSAGNPLFLQNYAKCRSSSDVGSQPVAEAAGSMLSKLTQDRRAVLQVLSVFRKPVSLRTLASLCDMSLSDLESQVYAVARLGLLNQDAETAGIRFPIIRNQLYKSIPKKARVRLNHSAFVALHKVESDIEVLSHYAFEAGMFTEAGGLYRELASRAYESRKYGTALTYYERLRRSFKSSGEVLTPREKLNLARCYDRAGKQHVANRLYQELLSVREVQIDPELLSGVYSRLAMTTGRIAAKERHRLLGLAVQCLPDNAYYLTRYAGVCNAFSRIGDVPRASEILERMQKYLIRDKDSALLNASRATLLLHTGDFRHATEYYRLSLTDAVERGTVLNNLAFCLEQLGDLKTALECQLRARDFAIRNGNVSVQIQSLDNIAAIRTKCGDIREAEYLLNQARSETRALDVSNIVDRRRVFSTVQADTAIHAIYKGDYAVAHDCITNIHVSQGVLFIESILCEIIRCKFFLEIGLTNKVREQLQRLGEHSIFSIDFFQVERAIIEAQFPETPPKDRSERLQYALRLSDKLGTLYQQCEVLISLASVHLELDERERAEGYVKKALELANKNGYRLLAARALFLSGLASEKQREKQHFLSDALQLASAIGLQELIAETAYHIGILNLESGNTIIAREYLIRSTSITVRLADGVPLAARSKYLAKKWRRDAHRALDRCNEGIPLHASALFITDGEKYFAAAYRFTMAAVVANSVEGLLASIEKLLATSLTRSAVIKLKKGADSYSISVRSKVSPELIERIDLVRARARNRVYFESPDEKRKQASAWIPMNSDTCEGGIYVACRAHESQFTEKEIELLTMMGTIASSALKRIEIGHSHETESQEVSEFRGIIGASKPIKEVYSEIQMAAPNVATVLIEGESGTGKELVAKAIHATGPRAKEPFITVDCGAIPEALFEAELFGAKRGSYTGAVVDRRGLFEAAHRGTIFLDEISNITAALQAKLLRVIQEREVRRIGETKGRTIDVRLIVACNQSLEALADAGHFRKDLLYRLRVLHIKVPPLRSRRDDIPMLAHAFLQKLNTSNKTRKYFVPGVVNHLSTREFPGNVRELQHAIERAFFLAKGLMITEVPLEATTSAGTVPADEVQNWFEDISEGRKDFWSAIHHRYKRHDISREKVVAMVDFGLRSTRGSYKKMASILRLKGRDYSRFMDFLRRNDCLLDFRPYRKAAAVRREN